MSVAAGKRLTFRLAAASRRSIFQRRRLTRAEKMSAEIDCLEYYIKFPAPGSQNHQPESDYVFVADETKQTPIVLLFGWAGCQDKYLSKYSRIYEDRGLVTLRYTAPVKCLFWKRHQMAAIGEKIVKLLVDLNFEAHPVVVHCFSNGGAFLYQNFSAALENSPQPIKVKGVIFDSAPGKRRLLSLYRAVSAILGGNLCYNLPMSLLMTAFLSVIWFYEIVSGYLSPERVPRSNPFESLKKEKHQWPQHFIYSKADILIPYTDIEHFAAHRRKLGVDVTTLRFESSPHVKHYAEHRDDYVGSIMNFMNKCLNGGGK